MSIIIRKNNEKWRVHCNKDIFVDFINPEEAKEFFILVLRNTLENASIIKEGNKYCVYDHTGTKRLGCYPTEQEAKDRLAQIEMFKHMKESLEIASQECQCPECFYIFISKNACYLSVCPICGNKDDLIELTGIF